ncbi:MAG: hypothetical protein KGN16_22605 [Burkholderiales bacterium]|nr:hypothetical protein [Burkholderiales bacterium]
MAPSPARPIPAGWHRLTPHLICAGASDAVGFYGQVRDPFGHLWSLATHQRDLTPEQIRTGMAQAMSAPRDWPSGDARPT